VICSGGFGWGFSAGVEFVGSEEQPAINVNPAARIATNGFFMMVLSPMLPGNDSRSGLGFEFATAYCTELMP
jgi:hypothetical protein